MLRVLDLFSGIGGFSLGLERAGMTTVAFCEIDPYCRRVITRHWPGLPIFGDVASLTAKDVNPFGPIGIICGGFPCQDISHAGKRAGLTGERSGLWQEFRRLVGELRPKYAIVENVAALTVRGLLDILGDLANLRYDAEWRVLGADDIGASQHRKRLWLLAYPDDAGLQGPIWARQPGTSRKEWQTSHSEPLRSACGFWPPGPREVIHIPRMDDGPADRAHRLRALGNAVVPQIPEMIGRAIALAEAQT